MTDTTAQTINPNLINQSSINPFITTQSQAKPNRLKAWLQSFGFFQPLGFFKTRAAKKRFYQLAGHDELIDFKEWQAALGLSNPLVAKRLFELVDTDNTGFIDCEEYLTLVNCIVDKKSDRRFQLVFAIYDQDNDGLLQLKDIQTLLSASLDEQSLKVTKEDLAELAQGFLNYFDNSRKNKLSLEEFTSGIKSFPRIERLFQQFTHQWLSKKSKLRAEKNIFSLGAWARNRQHLKHYWSHYFWCAVYVAINIFLFAQAVNTYANLNASMSVQVARAFGACLNFNVALMLILMARGFWSLLRHSFMARLVPIDSLTDFHRRIGWLLVPITIAHTAAHIYNYWQTNTDAYSLWFNKAFLSGFLACLTFCILLIGVVYRKSRKREIFSIAHLFYALFILSLLVHGSHFFEWLIIPIIIYALDALYRTLIKTKRVKILAIDALSDGVTRIRFSKPRRFNFYPGDFLYFNLGILSRWQWHPFTLSAAPQADYVDLHIRNNGNWSGALHNLARKSNLDVTKLSARIDGPYGAPTTAIERAPVAVMVAAGIGVTPFASVLETLVLKESNRQTQDSFEKKSQTLYFHWLNRSQASYEWFQSLLAQAEEVLKNQFHLYIHLTSFNHNLTNIAMQIAVDEFYNKYQRDPFTQLRAITNPGRPNWPSVFTELKKQHPDQSIQVYYCGPNELGNELEKHCYQFGFDFYREKFD